MLNKFFCFSILFVCHIGLIFGQGLIQDLTMTSWHGEGLLMGATTRFKMDWKLVLEKQFLKLDFSSTRQVSEGNEIVFVAVAYYNIIDESIIKGTWFDSRGISLPIYGGVNKNEMVIFWGNDKTEEGKTTYTLINHKRIHVKDYILQKNDYVQFGEAFYTSLPD